MKVHRLDGEYEWLEEWIPKVRLVAPWEGAEALLEDERRMFEALDATGDVYDTVPYKAVQMVFFGLPPGEGSDGVFFGYKAIESELLNIEDLAAAQKRLGLSAEELLAEPHSYVDRFGEYKAPFEVAIKVAKHCCRTFTQDILRCVQAEEDALKEAVTSGYYTFPDRRYRSWRDNDGFEILRTRAEERLFPLIFNQSTYMVSSLDLRACSRSLVALATREYKDATCRMCENPSSYFPNSLSSRHVGE